MRPCPHVPHRYFDTVLADMELVLKELPIPHEVADFVATVQEMVEVTEESLHSHWFPKIVELFNTAEIAEVAPSEVKAALFRSANAQLTVHIQHIMDNSIKHFADAMIDDVRCPRLAVTLAVSDTGAEMEIVPRPANIEKALTNCVESFTTALQVRCCHRHDDRM